MDKPLQFDIRPKVVRADAATDVVIRSLSSPSAFQPDQHYRIVYLPCEDIVNGSDGTRGRTLTYRLEDGCIHLRASFDGEQEHRLLIEQLDGENRVEIGVCRVYSVDDDLFRLRPFKADFHIHSRCSDGRDTPAHVAAAARRIGLDLMAITDHFKYEPSLEAMRAFAGAAIALRIYPGEEIHAPGNRVHIINFGGRRSINDWIASERDTYEREIAAIATSLHRVPLSSDRMELASCIWCYQHIRQTGGISIFCHPYWVNGNTYNVPERLQAWHYREKPFDALELLGGYHLYEVESNVLQVARYYEESAHGNRMPIVGVSDAHGCETGALFGWYYTVLFCPSADLQDVAEAIRSFRSVAVEALPNTSPRAHGPFRLVKYTQFLLREFFPLHDRLCQEEGRLMLDYLADEPGAVEALAKRADQTHELMKTIFTE